MLFNVLGIGLWYGLKILVFFEVEGVVYYLFFYVGNFDIMMLVVFVCGDMMVWCWMVVGIVCGFKEMV